MCGIAGIYRRRGAKAPRDLLLAMAGELRHRGPDGTGIYLDRDFGMVATRLAIVDLDHGDQPLHDDSVRYWVMQNGEIYNYPELREELEELGHRLETHCDTEVIAHAYARWGAKALDRLNGDFAFAIWDARARELFLARDRFGVRPLFLSRWGGDFCFASEARALLRHPLARRELDPAALVEQLTTWANASGRAAFSGIRELGPGCYLRVGADGIREERRWWDIDFDPQTDGADDDELVAQLRALLEDSTRIRLLRADVPVSIYMSGGIDSTLVASLATRHSAGPLSMFGLGFTHDLYDESRFQAVAADALGAELHRTTVGPQDIARLLPEAVELAERPMLRTAPAPMLGLAGSVHASGVKVVLTGEGADEIFGGYDIFLEDKVRRFWAREPQSELRPLLFTRLNAYLGADLGRVAPFLRRFYGRDLLATGDPLYSHRIRFANTARCLTLLRDDVRARAAADPAAGVLKRLPARFERFTPLGRAQYIEIVTFLESYLLHSQADRMLMGRSVEGRFPYLDYRVAEFAARLPDRLRVLGLREKYALRKAAEDIVPVSIVRRKKQPYRAPIASTLLASDLLEALDRRRVEAAGLFDAAAVDALVGKLRRRGGENVGETDEMALVATLTTMILHERLVESPRLAPAALPTKVVDAGAAAAAAAAS